MRNQPENPRRGRPRRPIARGAAVRGTVAATAVGGMLAATLIATMSGAAGAAPSSGDGPGGHFSFDPRVGGLAPSPAQEKAAAARALAAVAHHPSLVAGSGQDDYQVTGAVADPDGAMHVRLDRTHAGLPVLGGDVVVHETPAGAVEGVSGTIDGAITVSASAKVSSARAAATSRAAFSGEITTVGTPTLVVDALGDTPRLAWQTQVDGVRPDQTPSRLNVLIDANTGAVISATDEIQTVTGTGHGVYEGTVSINTSGSAGNYQMVDPVHGNNTTTDLMQGTSGTGTVFTDADNVWGNGSQSDRASAGVDAHYGAAMTWDFYQNTLGRNGIFNNGQGTRSRVHYGNSYGNAFWDGTQMTYGDGAGNATPFTALDVAGHEMSHGVTQATAGLVYTGDAGGLNEGTSDIFGTLVEFYANNPNDPPDYTIGEELGRPLRYMYNPSLDGRSPNCYSSSVAGLNPHYSSAIANHFFFLLAMGSGTTSYGTSPTCNSGSVTGIGNDKSGKIWYRALATYMTSNETYPAARRDTLQAAADLYGLCGTEYRTVQAAWSAVAVSGSDAPCTGPTPTASPTPTSNPTPTPTPTPSQPPSGSCTAPAWNASAVYTGGQQVSYDGHTWQAKWWTQGETPGSTGQWGVWTDLGACSGGPSPSPTPTVNPTPTPTPTPTLTPTPTPTATPSQPPSGNAWAPGVSYTAGDVVTYGGVSYTCLQSHTSMTGWEPPNVPALWQRN